MSEAAKGRNRFPALANRDFRILWYGMLFASGTMAFQYYAQMWLIYSITDSSWALGLLGAIRGIATLLFGLYGGALADRMDRRLLLIVTETVALIVSLALGIMVILGYQSLWLIFTLIFIGAATASIDAPIRQALIPELVPQQQISNAVALTTAAQMGSFAVTPILAGFVIDAIGPGGAYVVSTIGNVGIILVLLMLNYRGVARAAASEPVIASIQFGVRYVRQQRRIMWIIVLMFFASAFGFALFHGPIARWAGDILGLAPGQYGLLAATWGVGTLIASYCLSATSSVRHLGKIMVMGALLFGASFLMFGLVRSIPLAAIAYFINGAAWTCASISATSLVQREVSNEVRGRVMSLFMISGAIAQMNSLLLGFAADLVGMSVMLPSAGLLCTLALMLLLIFVPVLRKLDQPFAKWIDK
ncbi:MAG: hypothetical protein CMQ19_12645 [Gammaproteobacteria bacterium]|nr:hypothetical protein [Gammaproteobacteria bacterium]|tara:strand:+ start:4604 stop:5857 length:1254 start_codon:yes stop_codon:yes gene_type:complete